MSHPQIQVQIDDWEKVSIPSSVCSKQEAWEVYKTTPIKPSRAKRRVFAQRNVKGNLEYFQTVPLFKVYIRKT